MGMLVSLHRVDKADMDEYLNDSSALEAMLLGENEEEADADEDHPLPEDPNLMDIGKSWDAIRFLMAELGHGAKSPLSDIIMGGRPVDEEQDIFGYGPILYLTPERVKEINTHFSVISRAQLSALYNADKMNEQGVYQGGWGTDGEDLNHLLDATQALQAFYSEAAKHGQAVICYMA